MSLDKLNAAFNILGAVQSYKRDKQTHENDLAQKAANNKAAEVAGDIAINNLAVSTAISRREVGMSFLKQQKQAMQARGSSAVNAAWAGIEGATSNDLMLSVMQEAAQGEVERDLNLQAIHEQTVARTADIVASTQNSMDFRNFSKPDELAAILGLGKTILDDHRRAGKVG